MWVLACQYHMADHTAALDNVSMWRMFLLAGCACQTQGVVALLCDV